jgi:hypothetical protein
VLLKTKFLDVAKFTTLTPLSLLISCELSFPIVKTHMLGGLESILKSEGHYFIHYFLFLQS